MARKSLIVEGMTASDVEKSLYEAENIIAEVRRALYTIKGAFPSRDYQSIATHLDKSTEIIARRIDVIGKSVSAETARAEKKEMDAKIKEALADPEKADALRELLNL
jgi:hypothetical protein